RSDTYSWSGLTADLIYPVRGGYHQTGAVCEHAVELKLGLPCPLDLGHRNVPIWRCPAHSEVLGDVLCGMAISLHPLCGTDVLAASDLSRPPKRRAVCARCRASRRSSP